MYFIWLDSKLHFNADSMLIIKYFLWRKKAEYAISAHYDQSCVWEEVLQNKCLNKYNHTAIDRKFYFYQSEGLWSLMPLAKILFYRVMYPKVLSCLWFNEVNRFTSRYTSSFTYTCLKLMRMNAGRYFHLNMFKDRERRAIPKLFHHQTKETTDPPPTNLRTDKNHSSMPI